MHARDRGSGGDYLAGRVEYSFFLEAENLIRGNGMVVRLANMKLGKQVLDPALVTWLHDF